MSHISLLRKRLTGRINRLVGQPLITYMSRSRALLQES